MRTRPGRLEPKPGEAQAAALDLRADRVEGGNHLTRHEARFVGHVVDHPPPVLDRSGRIDDNGDDRDAATQGKEAVAVRLARSREAPDAPEGGRTGRAFLAQTTHQLEVERVAFMPRIFG